MTVGTFHEGYAAGLVEGRQEKPRGRLIGKGLGWLLGVLGAFFAGVATSDQAKNGLCEMLPPSAERIVNLACAKEHQRVTQAEADSVIDRFLGMTSGALPERAWSLLSPTMQKQWASKSDFAAKYENVLWFERFDEIRRVNDPTTFNRFTVRYLAFTGKDPEHPDTAVNEYRQQVQLTRSGTVTLISDLAPVQRPDTHRWTYPRVRTASFEDVPGEMRAFGAPATSAVAGGDPTLAHGGLLRPICQLRTAEATWVYAPGSGWIPDAFLAGGTRDLSGMAFCDQRYVVVTQPEPAN